EGVSDVFAIRFILDVAPEKEKEACWQVYSLVTQEYKPDVSRLRDWISHPKENGYESLHTTVENKDGAKVEVQIRSVRMDQIAESGHASHWSYKGIKSVKGLDDWLLDVKKMLETPALMSEDTPHKELDEIFVFTPNGDLKQLPKGASVLDFAFSIHTKLGMTCSGAKVNGKVKSIREELHTGDVVEIMSNKNRNRPGTGST
ncbi:MAG: bifunctional (p)ppGpp synthetase/guanosine-3',5'-bis(diphosphate) 3'-pyrophosphohydrolase, partial [Bacteroidales bacterium]|nr:bifunctional (p)ppGpp synthetase/guanosine-3',5'-bis(diphosphate) 3'-pyrophosphohydrolase [Bacteroidales bacterium]